MVHRALERGDGVGEALPARGPRGEDDVVPVADRVDGVGLVSVEAVDAALVQRRSESRFDVDVAVLPLLARERLVPFDLSVVVRTPAQPVDGPLHAPSVGSGRPNAFRRVPDPPNGHND